MDNDREWKQMDDTMAPHCIVGTFHTIWACEPDVLPLQMAARRSVSQSWAGERTSAI
jgi:hypothetical protein